MRAREALALFAHGTCRRARTWHSKFWRGGWGEWPLLLKLANGAMVDRVLRTKAPLSDAVTHVSKLLDRRGLTAFDAKDPTDRHEAVGRSACACALTAWTLPSRCACASWRFPRRRSNAARHGRVLLRHETAGLDEIDTDELLQRLFRLSLLLALDLDRRLLRLHDVIRTWLRDSLGATDSASQSKRSLSWRLSRPLRRRLAPAWRPIRAGVPCSYSSAEDRGSQA